MIQRLKDWWWNYPKHWQMQLGLNRLTCDDCGRRGWGKTVQLTLYLHKVPESSFFPPYVSCFGWFCTSCRRKRGLQ